VLAFLVCNSDSATALATCEKAYWPYGPIDNKLFDNVVKSVLDAFKLACNLEKSNFPVLAFVAVVKC
jgi:hypothetical protein